MMPAVSVFIGVVLAIVLVVVVRPTPVRHQIRMAGFSLMVLAAIYVLFAILAGSMSWVLFEILGLAVFSVFAILGQRHSTLWLVAGWALHGVWDVWFHDAGTTPFVPEWYPLVCLGFDLIVAAYLLTLSNTKLNPANRFSD